MVSDNTHSSNITTGSAGSSGPQDNLATLWHSRIEKANTNFKKWEERMKCNRMEEYYCGEQWEPTGTNYEPYVTNLVFSTIDVKLPTYLFENPVYHVKPRPRALMYDIDTAAQRSQLREDLLNTIATDDTVNFGDECELAIMDAFFRFGIIEVGYSANWIKNPNAGEPVLRSDSKPYIDPDTKNVIKQPEELPDDERIYLKRIQARNFRVGGADGSRISRCNWCGYWEYVRIEDLKANPGLKNKDKLEWSGTRSDDFVEDLYGLEVDDLVRSGDLVKIWHIFDIRAKKRFIFVYPQNVTLLEEKFKRLPLFDLRFSRLLRGFLPLPPTRNWKSSQDEYNDAREQLRNHRKRFSRKYLYFEGAFPDEEEISKLINGGDGTFAKTSMNPPANAVAPMADANLGAQSLESLQITKDDFNIVSGTSSEQRGQSDRTTATQANLIDKRSQVRESRGRTQIARWLAKIGREVLLLAEEKFTQPVWVKMLVPLGDATGDILPETQVLWHQITMDDLKKDGEADFDFEVSISLDSLSPVANDDDKNNFITFLSLLSQFPEISTSPLLVREAAYRCGYRNERVIREMQKMAQLILIQKMRQLQGTPTPAPGQPGGGNNMAQGVVAQNTPNNVEQIRQQIQNQGVMPQ